MQLLWQPYSAAVRILELIYPQELWGTMSGHCIAQRYELEISHICWKNTYDSYSVMVCKKKNIIRSSHSILYRWELRLSSTLRACTKIASCDTLHDKHNRKANLLKNLGHRCYTHLKSARWWRLFNAHKSTGYTHDQISENRSPSIMIW